MRTTRSRTRIDGGARNDRLTEGSGPETLVGGNGNDLLVAKAGADVALLGAGDDSFMWDPGDGSDTVEGGAGADTMSFVGAHVAEQIEVTANGDRVRFSRDIGNVVMDTAGLERIDFAARGGADTITVDDLSGTDLASLGLDLEGAAGAGDGQPDRVIVNGTNNNDTIIVNGDADEVKVSGLAATVAIFHPAAANDRLGVNTLAGRGHA